MSWLKNVLNNSRKQWKSVRIVCTDMIGIYRVVAICKEDEQ